MVLIKIQSKSFSSDQSYDQSCDQSCAELDANAQQEFLLDFVNARLPTQLRRLIGASDIVQSVLFVANKKPSAFRGNTEEELRAWLVTIARNKIIDGLRRFRASPPTGSGAAAWGDLAAKEDTPSQVLSLQEDVLRLILAIDDLPTDIRNIVRLRYSHSLTFEQISQQLNIPTTSCRRFWLEGCQLLKQRLDCML